jgi:hypothetical protein
MSFWVNFEDFNPAETADSYAPFNYEAYLIHWRALLLLQGRDGSEIEEIVDAAFERIVGYNDHAKEQDVQTLIRLGFTNYLQQKRDGSGLEAKPGAFEELNIEPSGNVGNLNALLYSFDVADLKVEPGNLSNIKKHEYFAAYAIVSVHEYMKRRHYKSEVKSGKLQKIAVDQLNTEDVKRLAQHLLKGTEAVGFGERFQEEEILVAHYKREIEQLRSQSTSATSQDTDALTEKIEAKFRQEQARKASERSRAMNKQRHQPNYDAKALVLREWESKSKRYGKADPASVKLALWLYDQDPDYSYTPRVIARWIRAYAKEKGIPIG